jgi:hypothetical protein
MQTQCRREHIFGRSSDFCMNFGSKHRRVASAGA